MKNLSTVRIIFKDEGYGLTRDAQIIKTALCEIGFSTEIIDTLKDSVSKTKPSINLFLEAIESKWLNSAQTNILIPNPEWLRPSTKELLPYIDYVLCKTKHAEHIFQKLGCETFFTGFTGLSRFVPDIGKSFRSFLHLCGKSINKGTQNILSCWGARLDWPSLYLVMQNKNIDILFQNNLHFMTGYFSDKDIQRLQNSCGIHLCPSEAEGYGHTIIEGMSVGAVTITTDAPPMNEIIQPDRGFLVRTCGSSNIFAGTRWEIDKESLASTIDYILNMSEENLLAIGSAARDWFIENDILFRKRFSCFMLNLRKF